MRIANQETLVSSELSLEKMTEPNKLGKTLKDWWDSDAYKEFQKANEEAKQRAIGKYFMLSEEERIEMVEAITHIMCKAESEGCSHRGLQSALGIYPAGFWVDYLMDVHNALWTYYHDKKSDRELKSDLDTLDSFLEKNDEAADESGNVEGVDHTH